jgi:alkylglycerol monooxygenase
MDPLFVFVPIMLLCVGVEALVLRRTERPARLEDVCSGLLCGVLDQLVNALGFLTFLGVYSAMRARFAPVLLPLAWWSWALAIVAHDLAYYVFHRASHRSALLWAAHEVHHQSDEYTLAVSLRQGVVATWISWLFYLPLAIVGLSVEQFVAAHALHQGYQFFVHTRLVARLGPLEWVFATPSHHRVHHGRDAEQIDKNYGGLSILWDRLFGTFQREAGEIRYGVSQGITSWSPFVANALPLWTLARRAFAQRSFTGALRVVLGPPSHDDDPRVRREDYDGRAPEGLRPYLALHSAAAALVTFVWARAGAMFSSTLRVALALWVLATLWSLARIADGTRECVGVERARVTATITATIALWLHGECTVFGAVPWLAAAALSLRALPR